MDAVDRAGALTPAFLVATASPWPRRRELDPQALPHSCQQALELDRSRG
jgi:hypothetical protein